MGISSAGIRKGIFNSFESSGLLRDFNAMGMSSKEINSVMRRTNKLFDKNGKETEGQLIGNLRSFYMGHMHNYDRFKDVFKGTHAEGRIDHFYQQSLPSPGERLMDYASSLNRTYNKTEERAIIRRANKLDGIKNHGDRYNAVQQKKARIAEARRKFIEGQIAHDNPGGFRTVDSAGDLAEHDKKYQALRQQELRKQARQKNIAQAAETIRDEGKFSRTQSYGLEQLHGDLKAPQGRRIADYQNASSSGRSRQAQKAAHLNGGESSGPDPVQKSIQRHLQAEERRQAARVKEIERLREASRAESEALRTDTTPFKEKMQQQKAEVERLKKKQAGLEEGFNGSDQKTYSRKSTDTVQETITMPGKDADGNPVDKTVTVSRPVTIPKSHRELKREMQGGKQPTKPPASEENPTASPEPQSGGSPAGGQSGGGEPSKGQSGGAPTETQSGGSPAGQKSGGESSAEQKSGGDSLQARMLKKANAAHSNDRKYMFERLAGAARDFEADLAGVKDKNFKPVAKQYGLTAKSADGLRKQFDKKMLEEAGQGPTTMDWIMGNKVPQKAIGGAAIAGAMSSIFGGGQRSNADLYSNPFQ